MKTKSKLIVVASLMLNLLFMLMTGYVVNQKGGINYLHNRVNTVFSPKKMDNNFSPWYFERKSTFEILPTKSNSIVFLGDSITEGAEWGELFQNSAFVNRGISGDTTDGVLNRVNDITNARPDKVFIMIGINDLAKGKSVSYILNNYQKIINQFKTETSETRIIVQSILPVDNSIIKNPIPKTQNIIEVNNELESLCKKNSIDFINLYPLFANDNVLSREYTSDGLHLNGDGYLVWKKSVETFLS